MFREAMSTANLVDFEGLIDVALERLEKASRERDAATPVPFRPHRQVPGHRSPPVETRAGSCAAPTDPEGVRKGLCLVGDAQQAIYAFRRGDMETSSARP
jgi:hypothetical protein